MKCKSCGERDTRPSHRNKLERAYGSVLPLRPYRCNACDHRQVGLASPILDKPRIISYSVVLVLVLAIIALSFAGGTDPVLELAESVGEPEALEPVADSGEPEPTPEPSAVPPAVPVETEPREPLTVSPFVAEQLARNRARQNGEPIDEPNRSPADRPVSTEPAPTVSSSPLGGSLTGLVLNRAENGVVTVGLSGSGDFARHRDLDLGDRLVVDLEGAWTLGERVQRRYPVDHGSVRSVRLGLHPRYLRLVFDLIEGARPAIGLENRVDGLTIRIAEP